MLIPENAFQEVAFTLSMRVEELAVRHADTVLFQERRRHKVGRSRNRN
jgi:hypothetical protein